jgi:hypothetical protein
MFLSKYFNKTKIIDIIYILFFSIFIDRFFNFKGLPYFRDLQTFNYFYNISDLKWGIDKIELSSFNFLVDLGFEAIFISQLFFKLLFVIGFIVVYYTIAKLMKLQSKTSRLLVFLLSFFYCINPFIYERFLMGQYHVIQGHFIFLPVIFLIYEEVVNFTTSSFVFTKSRLLLYFLTLLMTIFSPHHFYFILIITFLIFISSIYNFKSLSEKNNLVVALLSLLILILPSVAIIYTKYNQNIQTSYISDSSNQYETKKNIINSFSPTTSQDKILFQEVLIGGGSWMSKSFIENYEAKNQLQNYSNLNYYFSILLKSLIILSFVILLVRIVISFIKNENYNGLFLIFLLFMFIMLTFGYSDNFYFINQYFYKLPFSYLLRESGKFYSAVLGVFVLIYSIYIKSNSKIHYINFILFGYLVISNLILFSTIPSTIQYNNYPQSTIQKITNLCEQNTKTLYYPYKLYSIQNQSQVFSVYPLNYMTPCKAIFPEQADIENNSDNPTPIYTSSEYNEIQKITSDYTQSNNSRQDFESYVKNLKNKQISILVLDITYYDEVKALNSHLKSHLQNQSFGDDKTSIYKL